MTGEKDTEIPRDKKVQINKTNGAKNFIFYSAE